MTTLSPRQGRHGRDAQVDLAAAHGGLDAPVLRQAPLGDVELRHDLDARGDGGAQRTAAASRPCAACRRGGSARASESSRGSTWMSEACASTARAIRSCTSRMIGASLAMSSRRRTSSSLARSDAVGAASVADGGAAAVQPLERTLDVAGGHHALLDRPAEQIADGLDRLRVEGIGRWQPPACRPARRCGMMRLLIRKLSCRRSASSGTSGRSLASASGTPRNSASSRASSPPAPGRAGSAPDRSARPTGVCARCARCTASSSSVPRCSRNGRQLIDEGFAARVDARGPGGGGLAGHGSLRGNDICENARAILVQ